VRDRDLIVPPQNLEAERAVVGSIALDPAALDLVAPILGGPSAFYQASHRAIYEAMLSLAERGAPPDALTLRAEMARLGTLEKVGGSEALEAIVDSVPSAANAEYYARIVADRAGVRAVRDAATEILRRIDDAPEQKAEEARDLAARVIGPALERGSVDEGAELADVAHDEVERAIRGEKAPALPSGIVDLDRLLGGGLPFGALCVLAARPGCGKTSVAVQVSAHAAIDEGAGVAFFSLEMGRGEIARVTLAQRSGVAALVQRSGGLHSGALARLTSAREELRASKFRVFDGERTLGGIVARSRALARRGGLRLIVIDYLQLVESPGTQRDESRTESVGRVSRTLKAIARELNVVVLAAAQLNRAVEQREGSKPRLSDLRESGSIEQDADIVIGLSRDAAARNEQPGMAKGIEFHVLKHRGGATGVVPAIFDAAAQRVSPVARGTPPPEWAADERTEDAAA